MPQNRVGIAINRVKNNEQMRRALELFFEFGKQEINVGAVRDCAGPQARKSAPQGMCVLDRETFGADDNHACCRLFHVQTFLSLFMITVFGPCVKSPPHCVPTSLHKFRYIWQELFPLHSPVARADRGVRSSSCTCIMSCVSYEKES